MMKLLALSSDDIAAEVERRVVDHLHRLALDAGAEVHAEATLGTLRAEARALTLYAQRGLPVWDWTDSGMAADGLLSVLSALYSRAADADIEHTAIDVVDDLDPSDEIALVLVAAAARIRIDRGEPVTARELGALAGIGAYAVRHHLRSGELRATDERPARVPAEDARRWLAARGVPGFGPRQEAAR